MTLNKMMIIGNLGADPELRYTPSGKAVVNLRVAVNDRFRGQDGEWQEETYWFRVEAWEQAAERLAEQLRKGNKVFVEGQLRPREYEGSDGQKRTSLDIRFARVVSLERREPGESGYGGGASFSESASPVGPGGEAQPVARPRGAEAPAGRSTEAIDVDDIPF
jgi:single-strand DNA-binding protein